MYIYYIHDNGGRPFKVTIDDQLRVKIYKQDLNRPIEEKEIYYKASILKFHPVEVFIPIPSYDDLNEYDQKQDFEEMKKLHEGSSLLIMLEDGSYVYIGEKIYQFKAHAPIIDYHSIVGNSDVPYPVAVDEKGNLYLMTEDTILVNKPSSIAELILNEGANIATESYVYYYRSGGGGFSGLLGIDKLKHKVLQKRLW